MKDLRALLDHARASGHDALGVAHDPESLRLFADARRESGAMDAWWGFVQGVGGLPNLSEDDRTWLARQKALKEGRS